MANGHPHNTQAFLNPINQSAYGVAATERSLAQPATG